MVSSELSSLAGGGINALAMGNHFDAASIIASSFGSSALSAYQEHSQTGKAKTAAMTRAEVEEEAVAPVTEDTGFLNEDAMPSVSDFDKIYSSVDDFSLMAFAGDLYDSAKEAVNDFTSEHGEALGYSKLAYHVGKGLYSFGTELGENVWDDLKIRGTGLLRAAGGAGQMLSAAFMASVSGGTLSPLSVLVGLHGADDITAGLKQSFSGNYTQNLTEKALSFTGMSPKVAGYADMGLGLVGIVGEGVSLMRFYRAEDAGYSALRYSEVNAASKEAARLEDSLALRQDLSLERSEVSLFDERAVGVPNKVVTIADVKSPKLNSFEAKSNILNTFKNGHAVEKYYPEGTRLYRIGDRNGAFWATEAPPSTELQWRMDYAVHGEWNNMSNIFIMDIPKGSSLSGLEGVAGPQRGALFGGKTQVFIDWKNVPEDWIKTIPLRK